MSALYFVESTDGSFSFIIQPATIDGPTAATQHTDLKLVGSGMYGWGQSYVQNFFRLLENFACEEKIVAGKPVPKEDTDLGLNKGINEPVVGQAWFNKTRNALFLFDGTDWVNTTNFTAGPSVPPASPQLGQLWYDTGADPYTSPVNNVSSNGVLKVYDGSAFVDVALPITDKLYHITGGTVYGSISTGGETAPDVDSGGICINHGSNDGYALTIKNSDVAHPFTSVAETDTYFRVMKTNDTTGGALIQGFSEATQGVTIEGMSTTPSTLSQSLNGKGAVNVTGYKSSGTGTTSLSALEDLFTVSNNGTTKLLVKGDGALELGGSVTATTLALSGLASSGASLASITSNSHLTTKEYVDVNLNSVISSYLYEPVAGHWFNNGVIRLHNDGGVELGKYIDLHFTDASIADYDVRIDLSSSPVLRIWDGSATHGQFYFNTTNGQTNIYSTVSGGTQILTLSDYNVISDAAYPTPSSLEFLTVGKIDNTKGGARIRSFYKTGLDGNPGLLLESIKADNGQLFAESGAVTINAARYVAGVFQQKDANDNLLSVTNHMTNRLVVKGDGRVIGNGVATTDANQLTSKTYVDNAITVAATNLSTFRGSYVFQNATVMPDWEDNLYASVYTETHSSAKGIYATLRLAHQVQMDDIYMDTGAFTIQFNVLVWYNGNIVASDIVYWNDNGYGGVTADFTRELVSSVSYYNATPGTIQITTTCIFSKNPGALGCTVNSSVVTNDLIIR